MILHIERIRENISTKLLLKEGDSLNLHFQMPDGETMHFEDVHFDRLLGNIGPFRKAGVNGYDKTLFTETDEDNDFDQLEQY